MPSFAWTCHACEQSNAASLTACGNCGLPAYATGSAIAAKRAALQARQAGPESLPLIQAVSPDTAGPFDLIAAINDLPPRHQIVGVIVLALVGAAVFLFLTAESVLVEALALVALLGCHYALKTLVRHAHPSVPGSISAKPPARTIDGGA
jgi:hypothetical protein